MAAYGIAFIDHDYIMVRKTPSKFIAARKMSITGQVLPPDFDDDTCLAEAVYRYHPPIHWVDA